ncbi:putative HNH endonuclease [Erwinia phage pEa_SNUABM_50]|uniref:HNH endonuclease n=4 Tax=Eneladusvirus BF TaxID=2560751 RepID=A0A1S6UBD5_9CAUD|nr:HNH endonuclease [Serratia phage BF]QOI71426.1 putative HNH endonuclease [Erwinia phage pEa_SNUABM_12]QOI71997.1 putative HNH endonuclease [Erwinia phage pEa_SNUABM_47]QOI72537.1 putative HNH endonuclease [Erwinia phage pEa_SNUABM_50]QXO11669.1 hypothetical protein pEaSNUABM19_00558 [Erwinia phage pEa_SNUABM_19]QXO12218.1 hypothetical protein pEaSNUABM44_00557 [Erwinia phage pEa_SNUABM_44]QXO12772.1 hypothetical protein pEaSNUABM49_00559 [Erwinia phage pEa_SNUABM_49]
MIKLEFNSEPVVAYRNTCCMCCGIPQVSNQHFLKPNGKPVQVTSDHVLLKSLGGSAKAENLVVMCYDCNQLRANLFAELEQFIDWYWSGKELPTEKNFSYIKDNPKYKRNYRFTFETPEKHVTHKTPSSTGVVLPSKNTSVPLNVIVMNGVKYQEYKHPLFGNSLIKIED